ncbi:MAG: fatty acid desaturase [Ignavibacteriae bacterium HGW-Ignavibacteriae-3]|nr:MAG: fatty acid desaturase [Ignavibacteriae bacterium HGW-Ignavibacteriae-3]
MLKREKDFKYSELAEPHKERTREILKTHPEVRNLITRNQNSFYLVIGVAAMQIAIAVLLADQSVWLVLATAWVIGAFANHTLFVLIHECSHNLIFKSRAGNRITSIICDLPMSIPTAISFRSYHLKHHSFQGNYYLDADLASRWEAKLIGNTFVGKAMWFLFFPVFQALRPPRLKEIEFMNKWTIINWTVVFGFDIFLIYFFGWIPFLYFAASLFFSVGLHPLGARWIQEHYLTAPPQETYSYYGPLNVLALNVGFHNEHHDFPSIPWNNLPQVKKAAPEFYDNLVFHKSWTKLILKFIFDPSLSLFSRMVRSNRNEAAVQE